MQLRPVTGLDVHPLPPFYDISVGAFRDLQKQQALHVNVGLERLPVDPMPKIPDRSVQIAFCTTALRRPTVLTALKINVALTWRHRANITWYVVDFNTDTAVQDTICHVLEEAVAAGHLRVFASSELPFWHASVAKNTAHMLPDESYDALCNVDGDNVLTTSFCEVALIMAGRIKGGEVNVAQFAASEEPGTCGRIMIKRDLFHQLGGYDEEFHPVGCQDFDLVARATCASLQGAAVLLKDPKQIGLSIANRPHAGWSECIKEKVVNVDLSLYAGWKFGKMDSENRHRMHSLLSAGVLQRNDGKRIGVRANEVKLRVIEMAPPDPEDVPDWGSSPYDDADDDPGVTGLAEASATNVAAAATPPAAPEPPCVFSIATFGVEKLTQALRGRCHAAQRICDHWLPTKGGAPRPIPQNLVVQALEECWRRPDVILDARTFRPDKRDWTVHHVGYSITLTKGLIANPEFTGFWNAALVDIFKTQAGGVTPVNIAVFCRAGEKRSVSIAWLLSECLKMHGFSEVEEPVHLCNRFWGRKTCGGRNFPECDRDSAEHRAVIASLQTSVAEVEADFRGP